MAVEDRVVIGKHYWLTSGGSRGPCIIKVYNVTGNSVDGLILNIMVNVTTPSEKLDPIFSEGWPTLSDGEPVTVFIENIGDKINPDELSKLKQIAKLRIDYFFSEDVVELFLDFLEATLPDMSAS